MRACLGGEIRGLLTVIFGKEGLGKAEGSLDLH